MRISIRFDRDAEKLSIDIENGMDASNVEYDLTQFVDHGLCVTYSDDSGDLKVWENDVLMWPITTE